MRLLMIVAVAACALVSPAGVAAQEAQPQQQQRHFCTHATSRAVYGCPSLGPSVGWRMARFEASQEARELRSGISAALSDGRCEDARKMAVDKGRHELAARIRRACAAAS